MEKIVRILRIVLLGSAIPSLWFNLHLYSFKSDLEKTIEQHNLMSVHYKQLTQDLNQLQSKYDQLSLVQQSIQKQRDEWQKKAELLVKQLDKQKNISFPASRSEFEAGRWSSYAATYYDANVISTGKRSSHPAYGITASGRRVQAGVTIAVDPRLIPLDTWVEIQYPDGRMEMRRADDTGSAVKGKHIDIYVPKANSSMGKQQVKVRLLKQL